MEPTNPVFVDNIPQIQLIPYESYTKGTTVNSCYPLIEHILYVRVISFDIMIRKNEIIIKNYNNNQRFWLDSTIAIHTYTIENLIHVKEGCFVFFYKNGEPQTSDKNEKILEAFKHQYPQSYGLWVHGQIMPFESYEQNYVNKSISIELPHKSPQ